MKQEDLEVEISNLETDEPSPIERYAIRVGIWFRRRVHRPRILWVASSMALVLVLMLLVLRSTNPVLVAPTPTPASASPAWNLFSIAVDGAPGETLVISPDGIVSALHQSTSKAIWHYQNESGIWGVPISARGIIFMNSGNGRVIALHATTGKVLWSHYEPASSASVLQVAQGDRVRARQGSAYTRRKRGRTASK